MGKIKKNIFKSSDAMAGETTSLSELVWGREETSEPII
jgi:hypothetical protein